MPKNLPAMTRSQTRRYRRVLRITRVTLWAAVADVALFLLLLAAGAPFGPWVYAMSSIGLGMLFVSGGALILASGVQAEALAADAIAGRPSGIGRYPSQRPTTVFLPAPPEGVER